ncbi:hypothetical protein ZYGR_0AI06900 [Zygosaccharomyces rouxii]|uniref:FeS cluster biogenesis domain-containing protein n=1 Tax=Zygosaccharomyces rouxii TaxID=4956 RepID=A0A1Q3AC97_ZYGRO|nr:hypothetical protein ZYGR_0AI06900 [Zygosaccharomyces rouxii]
MLGRLGASRLLARSSCLTARWYAAMSANEALVKPARIVNFLPGKQFEISQRAADRLNSIYKESKEVLRIKVESGGCHGFQYNLKLIPDSQVQRSIHELENDKRQEGAAEAEDEAEAEDFDEDFESNKDVIFVLPGNGAKVVLDESTLNILNKTTLTYTTELIGSTFKIEGGNMKSSCGCGSSFDVEANQ